MNVLSFNSNLNLPKTKTLCAFTIMVAWLYLFPLSGQMITDGSQLKWFMLTSAVTFLLLAHVNTRWLNLRLKQISVLTLSVLGLIFLDLPEAFCPPALLMMGICISVISAFVSMTLSKETLIYAVAGIVLGNLLSYVPSLFGLSTRTTIYLASLAVLPLLLLNLSVQFDKMESAGRKHFGNQFGVSSIFYLFPFVLFFELLAGIMYSQIWPAYLSRQDALPGIDLVPYFIALFVGYFILNRSLLLNLILAVVAAIICFIFWFYAAQTLYTLYALCFMILAAGFIDVTIIHAASRAEEAFRAYVLLQGSILLGISLGNFIFVNVSIDYHLLSLIGLLVVNGSLICLLLLYYFFGRGKLSSADTSDATVIAPDNNSPAKVNHKLLSRLSEQEYRVVTRVLAGATYKDIADELSVSESSIKTYMQRIYKKLGVYNLRALKQQLKS